MFLFLKPWLAATKETLMAYTYDITTDVGKVRLITGDKDITDAAFTDEEITYQLLGPEEADVKKGSISVLSPLGRSLLGKEVGDDVTAKTPGGTREFEVMDITASEMA